jgi:DNA replication protein
MKKWYQENFVSRRDWILGHAAQRQLTAQQTLILLLIDYDNQFNVPISLDSLAKQANLTEEQVDEALTQLCIKEYLRINTRGRKCGYDISGLFEQRSLEVSRTVFETFESEFGRPLSQNETMQLAEWLDTYPEKTVLWALREAMIENKPSMKYIEKILSHRSPKDDAEREG